MRIKTKSLSNIFFVGLVVTAFLSCVKPGQEKEMKEVALWKFDTMGCKKIRTKEMAEKIIEKLLLKKIGERDFLKYFGKPNKRLEIDGNLILEYYFDGICESNKLIDSADYCLAEYTFRDDKLLQRNYSCR